MQIKFLEIENILSIEKASVTFEDSGLVLVEGWNHDDGRANGAGKTAIFNALTFAIYDKLPRKVTASEIVRRGCKGGFASATIQVGGDIYTVQRKRPKGVQFTKNGQVLDLTQTEWESVIKLTYDQFLISMYSAQRTTTKFIELNDSSKKDFLLKLLDLSEFTACKKLTDSKLSLIDKDLQATTLAGNNFKSKIEAYRESIVDTDVAQATVDQLRQEVNAFNVQIKTLEQIQRPDLSKFNQLQDDVNKKLMSFATIKAERDQLFNEHRKLTAKIRPFSGDTTCGACGTALDISDAKVHHEKEVEALKEQAATLKISIDECDVKLAQEQQVQELSKRIREKRNSESSAYDNAIDSIKDLSSKISMRNNRISSLSDAITRSEAVSAKIAEFEALLEQANTKKHSLSKQAELLKTVASICSPTGAQAYILDSIIETFNDHVTKYVDLVWSNATYKLISYKENSGGDIVAKFSENLAINGKEVSIGSLSGGEFRALSLCVDFAIIDVLSGQFGMKLNPIVMDEPFDGLDSVGRELVIDLLEKLALDRLIFVIDHATEAKSMFTKSIKVEKRNGVSAITVSL
jgi:DNA repair exonuclease SbcCD ATPase subunit